MVSRAGDGRTERAPSFRRNGFARSLNLKTRWRRRLSVAALWTGLTLGAGAAVASETASAPGPSPQDWAVHGQATFVEQATLGFHSPYRGPNSLDPAARGRETLDATLSAGFRPWRGGEIWIDPEVDQGFGLSDTLGVAGFPSGEAYKIGKSTPYVRLQRAFLRQTIDLGGAAQAVDADFNQLAGKQTADRLVLTIGKLAVSDIFDTNSYAHDPRHDFMNWALIDAGVFDYAADAWGYTYGGAAEWYVGRWTVRAGLFDLSTVPNSETLETDFRQFQTVWEVEERHQLAGRPGKLEVTGFLSRGRIGSFADALRLARSTGQPVEIAAVRRYQGRAGLSFNAEQEIADGVGLFAHGGLSDGRTEPYEFSDIDRSLASGIAFNGRRWGRPDDTLAFAGVINGISRIHRQFLNAGGLGLLVGDGRLPHPGPEAILESYYAIAVARPFRVTVDAQVIENPAYNRDRGPVPVMALRLRGLF